MRARIEAAFLPKHGVQRQRIKLALVGLFQNKISVRRGKDQPAQRLGHIRKVVLGRMIGQILGGLQRNIWHATISMPAAPADTA